MFYLRLAQARGRTQLSWLDSRHSFSFGHYFDPQHMGFSALRVINDDRVRAGAGFGTHGHRDMEIITYVLEGAIEHQDSMGNHFVVPAGELQRMSAGTGLSHSEYNHSQSEGLRFLQIWIAPSENNANKPRSSEKASHAPSYEQRHVPQQGQLTALVTPDGRHGSLSMHQDASIYRLQLNAGDDYDFTASERPAYLHVISGELDIAGYQLKAGDALGWEGEQVSLLVKNSGKDGAKNELHALWFDLPAL